MATEKEIDDLLTHARLDEQLSVARQADAPADKVSMAEAAVRGGARGATFGLADEAYGVLGGLVNPANMPSDPNKSAWSNFKDRYSASRDYAREHDQQAAEEHPVAFRGAELAGTVASPIGKIFAPAKAVGAEAAAGAQVAAKAPGVLSTMGRGAAAGALSGFGGSTADNPEGLAADVAGGAALGGGLSGGGRLASNFLGKLTPDNLKTAGTRLMAKASGIDSERAARLLGATDEAGPAVVGYGSKASAISDAAAQKARFFGTAEAPAFEGPSGPTWRPFGGKAEKVIGGPLVSEEEQAARAAAETANAIKSSDYQSIAASAARKAEDQGANSSDFAIPGMGIMASLASGHMSPKHIAAMVATGVAKKVIRERGASTAGRMAFDAGQALEAVPAQVGTVAGAANQYLGSGQGAQAVTQQAMGGSPESASDLREKRLRDIMVKRLRDLSNQGYASPSPVIIPQSP